MIRLPDAYQEVRYIQSSGTQYIDTLLNANQNTIVEAKWSLPQYNTNTSYDKLYGSYGPSDSNTFFMQSNRPDNNKIRVVNYVNTSNRKYVDSSADLVLGQVYETKHTNTEFYINGTLQGTCAATSYTSAYTVTIFAAHNGSGVVLQNACMKLYYFKMYDGTTLVRDFVPCYRKSDNVIGLYDLVNDTFYTNAGTGTFTKGKDVVPKTQGLIKKIHLGDNLVRPNEAVVKYILVGAGGGGVCRGVGGGGGEVLYGDNYTFPASFSVYVGTGGCYSDGGNSYICAGGEMILCARGGHYGGTSGTGCVAGGGGCFSFGGGGGASGNGGGGVRCQGGSGGAGVCGYGGGGGGGGFCWESAGVDGGGNGGAKLNGSTGYGPGCPAPGCGGGGGGGAYRTNCSYGGGRGGGGIAKICYLANGGCGFSSATGGDCCYTCDGYCVHEFITDGTFTVGG